MIVVLCDDMGFADIGCYGSEVRTPNLDRFAEESLRFSNFHVNPACSPTRASLLTGVNAHAAGMGTVANFDPGFPGYTGELAEDVVTAAEILRANGYGTFASGKWHLCKDADCSAAGAKHSWPVQRGFDRFYGFLGGMVNLHGPADLMQDNHSVGVDEYPEGYYLTDDITDQAIDMVRTFKASDPTRPFFLYLAHAAPHAPLHAKAIDMERYRGVYDAGWDHLRDARFRRQVELGLLPSGIELPPRNYEDGDEVVPWEELTVDEQRLFARYMEAYAAMIDSIDQNFGCLREALTAMGEWDNSIVLFLSDNGASREGGPAGTTRYLQAITAYFGGKGLDLSDDLSRIDSIGGPQSLVHYPRGWAMVSNTPFRLYKGYTHAGGHTVPLIMSTPGGAYQPGSVRDQYVHVTDVLPTLLDIIGIEAPGSRLGRELKPMAGVAFTPILDDPDAPTAHTEQYYASGASRGYYRDGWEVVSRAAVSAVVSHHNGTGRKAFDDDAWELYNVAEDRTERDDLAEESADLVAELAKRWDHAAWCNQVHPIDLTLDIRSWLGRPTWQQVFSEPVTIYPGTTTLERYRSSQLIANRDFTVEVSLDFAPGDRGILVAHGEQGGGYALYVDGDELFFVHNGYGTMTTVSGGTMPAECRDIVLDVVAPGGFVWTVTVVVGGETRATVSDLPLLLGSAPFSGIDVGLNRGSPVSWDLHQREGSFPYTGALHSVRYVPGELSPDHSERLIEHLIAQKSKYE